MGTGIQRTLSFLILFAGIAGGAHLANQSAQNSLVIRAGEAPAVGAAMLQSAQQLLKDGISAGLPKAGTTLTPQMQAAQLLNGGTNPPPPAPAASPAAAAYVPSEVEIFGSTMKHGSPRAVIHTTMGDIVLKLDIAHAPKTVKNFMELAHGDMEYTDAKTSRRIRRPFYDGLTIHKVIPDSFIQMGCPFGNGRGGPGYTLPDEISKSVKFDRPGVVAMALAREGTKATADSNGSQFFITLEAQPKWDGVYTIFGEVESGLDVVRKISNAEAGPTDRPIRRIYTTSVEIKEDDSGPTHVPASAAPPTIVAPAAPAKP